jgi:hypothetical protein
MELAHHDDIPLGAAMDAHALVVSVGAELQVVGFQGVDELLDIVRLHEADAGQGPVTAEGAVGDKARERVLTAWEIPVDGLQLNNHGIGFTQDGHHEVFLWWVSAVA